MKMSVLALATLGLAAGWGDVAFAQTSKTATILTGRPTRIAVETALTRECKVGQMGGIRVITAPTNGTVSVKSDKLKTPKNFRCPEVETPVQTLIYLSNKNYKGSDELVYETRTPEGSTQTFTVKIIVTDKPPQRGGSGVQDL